MRFIMLGISPGLPNLDTHLSALYVQVGENHLLFDCGEGTYRQLLRHQLDQNKLDAIYISHYHPDHLSGIFMVLQMLYLQNRSKPLHLFLPERPAAVLEMIQLQYTFIQKFSFPLQIHDCKECELYYPEVTPVVTDHLLGYAEIIKAGNLPNQMSSYGFMITDTEGSLLYTSDIATTDCLSGILPHCHTVIIDALHPEARQVLKLEYSGIKRILLTHGISDELKQALAATPSEIFDFAREDTVYTL